MGHIIALCITAFLMLIVAGMLVNSAVRGPRRKMKGARRWAPCMVFGVAYPLILADPLRHVLGDYELWPGCGNNPTYNRINNSNPYPSNCAASSYEYRCVVPCCVSTWTLNGSSTHGTSEWMFYPPQTTFFPAPATLLGQWATLNADGDVYFPEAFDRSAMPYQVYEPESPYNKVNGSRYLLFWETGGINTAKGGETDESCHPYKVNPDTGYCLMEAFDKDGNVTHSLLGEDGTCDCSACNPSETMPNLSPMGIVFTIVFTYCGFILLTVAVLWNANFIAKLKIIKAKWKELKEAARADRAQVANESLVTPLSSA
jgi:hypothetical protein